MRTRLAQFFLAAVLSCGLVAAPTASFAQAKKGAKDNKKGAKDDTKGKDKGKVAKEVNLDEGGDTARDGRPDDGGGGAGQAPSSTASAGARPRSS